MPLLTIRQLNYSINNNPVLSGIDCQLRAGEIVGLIGANGAGKSTLLRVLMGLQTPDSGEVWIRNRLLRHYSRRSLARQITLVPQDTGIQYPFSVRELVTMGRHPYLRRFAPLTVADHEIIQHAMQQLEVHHFADRSVTQLSGGERQRVFIARALAQQTSVILLDEATASLDLCHQLDLLNAAKKLARDGHLVIAAIHDLTMASRFCDRLLLLSKGALVADGKPQHVLTRNSLREHFTVEAEIRQADAVNGLTITPLQSLA